MMKPTYLRVGVPHNRARPPTQIRPPTQGTPGDVADESRTYSYNAGSGNPSHDWLIPNNVVAGDLIIVGINIFTTSGSGLTVDMTPPAGYTNLVDLEETGNGVQEGHYLIYYKVADGAETDTTFTTDEDCRVVFMSNRIASNGGTLGTPVVGTVSTDASGNIDPNPVSPGTAGDYAVQVWLMHNNGSADPDNASAPPAGYTFVDYVTSEAVARRPRIYLCQGAFAISTSEDPGVVGWDGTVEFTLCRTFTVAVRLDAGSAPVAAGDHTHTESDITDLDHWTEADHDALDHTGLTGVGVSDHGGLSGLTDDDHTQYVKADGTRAFTGTVSGVTPTLDAHLATKGYVDTAGGGGSTVVSGPEVVSGGSLRYVWGVDTSGRPTYTAAGTSESPAIVVFENDRYLAREV